MRWNFICAGQSNMSGRGALPAPAFPNAGRVWTYTNAGTWQNPATEPVDASAGQIDQVSDDEALVGPCVAFGDRLAELTPGVEIGLVPCAKGGYTMDQWRRDWRRTALYGSMLTRAREASVTGPVKGLLWWQGESEAMGGSGYTYWAHRFCEFIASVRQDLNLPDLPVIFAQLSREPNTAPWTSWGGMQAQQAQVFDPRGKIQMITTSDLTPQDLQFNGMFWTCGPHLVTASYVTAGRRFADAMHSLLEEIDQWAAPNH